MDNKNIYEQSFKIYSYLTDCKGYLAPRQLLLLMQEVAWAHVDKHNIGWDYLYQHNQFWALTRLHVKIVRMPKWHETIKIRTWGKLSEMITHYRDHEVMDEAGNVIISATSTWVILDFATGRPQRVENLPTHLYVNEHRNAIVTSAPKIKAIPFPEESRKYRPVVFSDLDVNQHVNNSMYLQMAIDSFPINYVETHQLSECYLNFIWQAKKGDYYAVQSADIAPDDIITSIFSKEGGRELARVETIWRGKS
ncbi:MAG: hypothetical protein LBV02_02365 [Bacteroidales bacterium]|jgi:acyl-ACP thioesterase|nr:hypothetical protein [Bacteroidales bacterium]